MPKGAKFENSRWVSDLEKKWIAIASTRHFCWIAASIRFEQPLQRIDDDLSRGDIDRRDVRGVERHQFGIAAGLGAYLDQIAGAEIMDGDDGTEIAAALVDHREADQIGVIELVRLVGLRQPLARHVELGVHKRARRVAIADAGKPRDEVILGRPHRLDLDHASVFGFQRPVVGNRVRIGRERAQPHFAAQTMRRADLPKTNARSTNSSVTAARAARHCSESYAAGAAPAAGAAAGAALAASACALRSLRGIAFSGLLRFGRFITPAASRKRITRSDGCAPLVIQALTLSRSSRSRSVLSLGNSGLK